MTSNRRRPCPGPFTFLGIRWDGQVSACCRDYETKLNIGNVKDSTIEELWNCKELNELRMIHVKGEFFKQPICDNCEGQEGPVISDSEIAEYLLDMGKTEEIIPYLKRVRSPELDVWIQKLSE